MHADVYVVKIQFAWNYVKDDDQDHDDEDDDEEHNVF